MKGVSLNLSLCILSGTLFLLALPPLGYSFLVLVCFVPWMVVIENSNFAFSVLAGFIFGLVAYIFIPISLLPWGWHTTLSALLITGIFFALFAVLIKGLSLLPIIGSIWLAFPLAYAVLQVLGEFVFSIPILLSVIYPMEWLDGQGLFTILGGRGVDYLVCGVNALVAACWLERDKVIFASALVGLLLVFSALHWLSPSSTLSPKQPLDVVTIDNAMSFQRVNGLAYSMAQKNQISAELDTLTRQAIKQQPDLIVWPEGGNGLANRQIANRRDAFKALTQEGEYRLIAGSKDFDDDGREYNVADYIVNGEFVTQINKQHRVPLIETDLSVGKNAIISFDDNRIGVGICFDIAFPKTIGNSVEQGAEALLILSNDASFGFSVLSYMHLRYVAVRAIEQARNILFVSNTGPSVVIDHHGRMTSGYIHNSQPRVEPHTLQLNAARTLYSLYPVLITTGVLGFVMLYLFAVRRLCRAL